MYRDRSEEEAGSNRNKMGTVGKQKERRRRIGTGSGQGAARCEVRGRRQGRVRIGEEGSDWDMGKGHRDRGARGSGKESVRN